MKYIAGFLEKITNSSEKKVLLGNFFSLSFLQAANYLLPLVTLPYLVRILGPSKYGLIAFAQAFVMFFIIFTEYGFNLSATREVSINRNNIKKISEIFSSVMTVKLICALLSFIVLIILINFVPKFKTDKLLYLFSFGMVIGNLLFPTWFFQGMERMKHITSLNILAKLIFTISIFIFIKSARHYIYVPLLNSLGFLTAGVLALVSTYKNFKVKFILPDFKSLRHQIKDGWHIFISNFSISLYTAANTFILGLFASNAVVGYYAAAEKIIRALTRLFEPLLRAVYPYISRVAALSKKRAAGNLKKILFLTFASSFAIFLSVIIFSRHLVGLVLGAGFADSLVIMRLMSPLLVIIPLAGVLANLGLLPFKLDRYFSKIYIFGAVMNLTLLFFFLYLLGFGAKGAAISNLITEFTLTAMFYLVLKKKGILS